MATSCNCPRNLRLVSNSYAFGSRAGFDHVLHVLAGLGFALARGGKRTVDREVVSSRYEQFFGREARDDFVARGRDDNFFFNSRSAPTVGGGPERLECEHHAGLDLAGMVEGHQA